MENFHSLGLPEALLESLKQIQFNTPTPIQAQAIPHALSGSDILGSAQTGTGKTGAYGIPLISNLFTNPDFTALIIAPTRELAFQIVNTIKTLAGKSYRLKTALLIGGDSISEQIMTLQKTKPRLLVGTPGRIVDLLERKELNLDKINYLVLDETDRMLDMGFTVDLDKIISSVPKERQTLMFSATISPYIAKISEKYLRDAIRISVGSNNTPNEKITQELIKISNEEEKYPKLLTNLNAIAGPVIIFVKTKMSTEHLSKRLSQTGFKSNVIHGDLKQRQRSRAIKDFKSGKYLILVATDIAARGLDIPNIECVINYDLPQCPEDYIHRIGRTGRAGTQGRAVNFVSNKDATKWRDICRLLNPNDASLNSARPNRSSNTRSNFRSKDNFRDRDNFNTDKGRGFNSKNKNSFGNSRSSFKNRNESSDKDSRTGNKNSRFPSRINSDNRNYGETDFSRNRNESSINKDSRFGARNSRFPSRTNSDNKNYGETEFSRNRNESSINKDSRFGARNSRSPSRTNSDNRNYGETEFSRNRNESSINKDSRFGARNSRFPSKTNSDNRNFGELSFNKNKSKRTDPFYAR